jgi:K+-sensing histidine kinase KdpD
MQDRWQRRGAKVAFSIAVVALVTGLVYALRPIAPVVSLGVLYVLAVVAVAIVCGLSYAIPVSVGSMLVFNFLFLAPVHTLALRESENWVALAVYLTVGVVVGELATRSRRLARQAVEAETLRQSDAVKTAVLHAVSHDLRSPLTAIRAASEGLEGPSARLDAGGSSTTCSTFRDSKPVRRRGSPSSGRSTPCSLRHSSSWAAKPIASKRLSRPMPGSSASMAPSCTAFW